MSNETSVAIVGLPGGGKTVLLTVLTDGDEFTPLTKAAHDFLSKRNELKEGKLPDATDPTEKAGDLEWKVSTTTSSVILRSKDFSGEVWKQFIANYGGTGGDVDANASVDGPTVDISELSDFLLDAAAIAVCVDLANYYDENDYDQLWIIQAIHNFLDCHNQSGRRLALILTKYDQVSAVIEEEGGLRDVLKKLFSKNLLAALCGRIFPVSAIQTCLNDEDRPVATPTSTPHGVTEVKDWVINRLQKKKLWRFIWKLSQFLLPIIMIFIGAMIKNMSIPGLQYMLIVGVLWLLFTISCFTYKYVKGRQ